jgi:hypothetical protein
MVIGHVFLTLALVADQWAASRHGCFIPGERSALHPLDRRIGGPQGKERERGKTNSVEESGEIGIASKEK